MLSCAVCAPHFELLRNCKLHPKGRKCYYAVDALKQALRPTSKATPDTTNTARAVREQYPILQPQWYQCSR